MNEVWLTGLPHGVPRQGVFRRVLATRPPEAVSACHRNWLKSLRAKAAVVTDIAQPVLAIGGKSLRRSHDRSQSLGTLHSVSVRANEDGLSLGQVAMEEKSNKSRRFPCYSGWSISAARSSPSTR